MPPKKRSTRTSKKPDTIPLAINILKLQRYNFKFFSTEEVIIFEYLTVKAASFKFKMFYHSSATIEQETGVKRSRLETILDNFKNLKIITIEVKGMPKVKHFKVNFEKIFILRKKIYRFNKLSPDNCKLLADYFKSLAEKSKHITEIS